MTPHTNKGEGMKCNHPAINSEIRKGGMDTRKDIYGILVYCRACGSHAERFFSGTEMRANGWRPEHYLAKLAPELEDQIKGDSSHE